MSSNQEKPSIYGLLAEFDSPRKLLDAVLRTQSEGYAEIDAFTPYPVEEITEAIVHHKKSKVSTIVALGALAGAVTGFALQYWTRRHRARIRHQRYRQRARRTGLRS